MSERMPSGPETLKPIESTPETSSVEREHKHEKEPDKAESAEQKKAKIEKLSAKAEQEAVGGKDAVVEGKSESSHSQTTINKELKALTLQRTLNRLRHSLSPPAKTFSKIVHQPAVDKISRGAEKTIARPKGILLGGILALTGSSVLLFTAKRYGFGYNLSVFFILFAAGYGIATILEFVVRLLKTRR